MSASPQEKWISREEYSASERTSPVKHEYYNGQIYAMAGGSPAHARLGFNISVAIGKRLQGKSCRGASSDQRVRIEASGLETYPDALVVCPPERYAEDDANVLLNPALIVEVLSPSTEAYDRGGKFGQYSQIDALRDYILVSQDRIGVEHFQRAAGGEWRFRRCTRREDALPLENLEITIPLEEIYEGLDVPSGLLMLHNAPDMLGS